MSGHALTQQLVMSSHVQVCREGGGCQPGQMGPAEAFQPPGPRGGECSNLTDYNKLAEKHLCFDWNLMTCCQVIGSALSVLTEKLFWKHYRSLLQLATHACNHKGFTW